LLILKDLIKAKRTPWFDDIAADELTLWLASIPNDGQGSAIKIDALVDKIELNNPRRRLSMLFPEGPDENTCIIVKRPEPGNADASCSHSHLTHELVFMF